jgi:pimeloyl-ACP methyl ester carboxylesterase
MEKVEVVLKGTEQKPISLDYHVPTKATGPIVVYAHGFNGFKDWGGMDLVAQQFARKGMPFVKFNFSHNGTTPEKLTEFVDLEAYKANTLAKELNDFYIVFNWIEKEFSKLFTKKLPKVLIGHSKGGSEAILFVARRKGMVSKLITWSAAAYADIPWHNWPTDRMFAWKKDGTVEIENKRTKQKLLLSRELYEDFENHKTTYDVLTAATAIEIPWLICHGTEDETIDVANADILKKLNANAEVLKIKGTGHTYDRAEPWTAKDLPSAAKKLVTASIRFAGK